jgi:hypothetical protein
MTVFICNFCHKSFDTVNSGKNHEIRCSKNEHRLTIKKSGPQKKFEKMDCNGTLCSYGCGEQAKYKTQNGMFSCADVINKCKYMRAKISTKTKGKPSKNAGYRHTETTKKNMRIRKRQLYDSGWEPTCGRSKKYDYTSPIAGKIKVDGTWELRTAKYLDKLNVEWSRNKTRFPYTRPDGKESTYQPDFYVKNWNAFLEIKGYETDLDRAKWDQFPHTLFVWKKDKMTSIDNEHEDVAEWLKAHLC